MPTYALALAYVRQGVCGTIRFHSKPFYSTIWFICRTIVKFVDFSMLAIMFLYDSI